jgi:hypothetical protein
MQPDGTYQLIEALGSCQVGTVWSAVDAQGRSLTVAVLDPAAAADQRWRDAFASSANAFVSGEASGPRVLSVDFTASAPWVACAVGDGPGAEQIFIALGMSYHAAPSADGLDATSPAGGAESFAQPDTPAPPADGSLLEPPTVAFGPFSPPPIPAPSEPAPVSAAPSPDSAPPAPVSGAPQSPVAGPQPPTFDPQPPVSGAPQWTGWSLPAADDAPQQVSPSYGPGYPSLESTDFRRPRRRTGLWIGIAVAVVVALAAGGGIYAWQAGGGTPNATNSSSPQPVSLPTGTPVSPGVEPPKADGWPAQWPKYTPKDPVRTYNDLKGLGFPLKVPSDWECLLGASANGYVKYNCGVSPGDKPTIGGEVIVRGCPQPCDVVQQQTMRQAEEAWGVPWHQAGPFAVWGEGQPDVDGEKRHALVVVAFFRGGGSDQVDSQLVLRMTGPIDQAYQLRRVANYLRDTLVF